MLGKNNKRIDIFSRRPDIIKNKKIGFIVFYNKTVGGLNS